MKHFSEIPKELQARSDAHLLRTRSQLQSAQGVNVTVDGREMLSFCSNDYLGLANHPNIAKAMIDATQKWGVGGGASHLVGGHHQEHELLEQALAKFTGREAALVFGSGYMANVGIISALLDRKDSVLQDKLNHASLLDGGLLAQSKMLRYRHADANHLDDQLKLASGKKLVVTDGVFSMDGDCAPLVELSEACAKHDAWLMVDDAHGFGTLGPQGSGLVNELGLNSQQVPIVVGTLGKAFGTSGAFVAGDKSTIDYLLQFARTYIYTTATPPAVAAATRKSIELVMNGDDLRSSLNNRISQLRQGIKSLGLELMESNTAIQPIMIGENERAMEISSALKARGFLITAIRPPTVPKGTARLRITLSAAHSEAQVNALLNALEDVS